MLGIWFRLVAGLVSLLTLPLLVIRAQPYDDHGLREFLTANPCPPPCFLDIRPAVTAFYEADLLLERHDWVAQVNRNMNTLIGEPTTISWTWNGRQPVFFAADGRGIMNSPNGILVNELIIETDLPFGDMWLSLGPPDDFAVTTVSGRVAVYLAFITLYPDFAILGTIECPYGATLWHSRVALRYRVNQSFPGPLLAGGAPLLKRAVELEREICPG